MAGFVKLPHPPDTATLDKCTTYHSSATHDRLFCSTCGSKTVVHVHRYADGRGRNDWFAYSGAVERAEGEEQSNVVRPETNEWVDDAVDGGLAPYMTQLGERNVPAYHVTQSDPPLSQADLEQLTKPSSINDAPGPDARLNAECHCGAVKLLIKPADHTDKATSTLERFVPFHPQNASTGEKITDKYQARACVCRSCRLAMGVSLTTYTYIPPPKVLNAHTGSPLAYAHAATTPEGRAVNRGLEALKHYWSSDDACRSFCGRCGSTVFYWNEKRQGTCSSLSRRSQASAATITFSLSLEDFC